jgi:hypothetical protein
MKEARRHSMSLSNLTVLPEQPEPDCEGLKGYDGQEIVVVYVPIRILEDELQAPGGLTHARANSELNAYLAAFTRIVSAKYERKEYSLYPRFGSTIRRIDLTPSDIQNELLPGVG